MTTDESVEWTKPGSGQAALDLESGFGRTIGRCLLVAAYSALMALMVGWLFMGASVARTALVWACLGLLALCVLVAGVASRSAGRPTRAQVYAAAVRNAGGEKEKREGLARIPAVVCGTGWRWFRSFAIVTGIPTLLVLWPVLAVSDPYQSHRASALAEAGVVIDKLPSVAIDEAVRNGTGRRSDVTANYTVVLPTAGGGQGTRTTFRATVANGKLQVGNRLFVAHSPGHPELGAIGDDRRSEVERQLDGRTLEYGDWWMAWAFWALLVIAPAAAWLRQDSLRRRARRVTPDWVALRAKVTGSAQHVDAPPEGVPNRREKSRTLRCLMLDSQAGQVPFAVSGSPKAAAASLRGVQGWLLWDPSARRRGGDVLAELVGDDGWQLSGAVPERIADQVADVPREPVTGDASRRVRTLELGALWPSMISVPLFVGFLVALGCVGAMLVLPADSLRWQVAAVGFAAPFVGWLRLMWTKNDSAEAA